VLTCFAKVTENVIKAGEKLQVIGRFGVGVDNIAVDTATALGIAVTYVPDYCMEEVSDHVFALLLAFNRRVVQFNNATKTDGWGSLPLTMRIMRLRGKTLGIVGYGRIGRAVAAKAKAFGMEILAADPFIPHGTELAHGARLVDFNTLLQRSDFVTLHSPLTPETRDMIDEAQLQQMKPEAFLINAARGPLINEPALYKALTEGWIAGAGVDVMADNVPPKDHPLMGLDNFIVTPHVAFFSQESVLELEERGAGEVASVLHGRMPDNLVNPAVLEHPKPRHKLRKP
jgi:D-3-phosphoglycerate dehydrogenase